MSVFFSTDDRPCCKFCRNQLPANSPSGHCPHCRRWYAVGRATVAPSRTRAIALLLHSRPEMFRQASPTWTGLAAVAVIIGNTTVLIVIGWISIRGFFPHGIM
jgi:hypothetical protein